MTKYRFCESNELPYYDIDIECTSKELLLKLDAVIHKTINEHYSISAKVDIYREMFGDE